jgi:FkbM family methyltransferase
MTSADNAGRDEELVRGLYRGLLGREPDAAGLKHWLDLLAAGGDPAAVFTAIVGSDEYRTRLTAQASGDAVRARIAAAAGERLRQRPLTVVDVGAQELESEDHVYSPLAGSGLPLRIIGFEPLEHKLAQSRERNPDGRVRLYPTFIGDGGEHMFHINEPDATSSLLPFNSAVTRSLAGLHELRTMRIEKIQTETLDRALSEVAHVDFLKLDIQGFELTALKHASAVLARTNVVHCEVSFAEIYQGQALFAEVEQYLRGQGFQFIDFSHVCRYPYRDVAGLRSLDRLGWADAVFFRNEERTAAADDLLAQALVALFVYRKPTLAAHLARRHDALAASAIAALFG